MDINLNLAWHVRGNYIAPDEGAEDTDVEITGTPWKPKMPTMTGSSKFLIRVRCSSSDSPFKVRLIEGWEAMRLIGWCDSLWKQGVRRDHTAAGPGQKPFSELLLEMGGNAYAIWHCIPWSLALLSTIGKYGTRADENDGEDDVDIGSDGSAIEADSDSQEGENFGGAPVFEEFGGHPERCDISSSSSD